MKVPEDKVRLMENVKVGIVGAGTIARAHIRAFMAHDGVTITGIFSRTRKKAEEVAKEFSIQNVVGSIDELHALKLDIVVIAVSVESVKDVCKQAFKFSWWMLIEKPVGINYEEAVELNEFAEKHQAKAFVALNRRFFSSTRKVLGKLKSANEQRLITVFDQEDPKLHRIANMHKETVDNLMYTNSIHIIDFFLFLGRGEITNVTPVIKWDAGRSNFVSARIDFSSGDIGLYNAVWDAPGPWSVTVSTQKISLQLKPLEVLEMQEYGSRKVYKEEQDEMDNLYKTGFYVQAGEMIKAVKGEANDSVSIKEALRTMKVTKEIYEL